MSQTIKSVEELVKVLDGGDLKLDDGFRQRLEHYNRVVVHGLPGWEDCLSSELVSAMKAWQARNTTGVSPADVEYETLYVSTTHRRSLEQMLDDCASGTLELGDLDLFRHQLAPALEAVGKEFKVLGCLALPSSIDLAKTDLSAPRVVFCFVTIEKVSDLPSRLQAIGYPDLTLEGHVDTLHGRTWYDECSPEPVTLPSKPVMPIDLFCDQLPPDFPGQWMADDGEGVSKGVEGYVVVEEEDGRWFPWPAPKCQAELEEICVIFALHFVNVKSVYFTGNDFKVYRSNLKPVVAIGAEDK